MIFVIICVYLIMFNASIYVSWFYVGHREACIYNILWNVVGIELDSEQYNIQYRSIWL